MEIILLTSLLLAGFYMAWSIGANDVANAMGTSVGSKALTLRQAVMIAAVLEFCGAFFFGSYVSETVQSGIIDQSFFTLKPILFVLGMLSALLATGFWLQIASYMGWPVSTTHSIVGALVGFGLLAGGSEAIYWANVTTIVFSWMLSPILGGFIAYFLFSLLTKKILYQPSPAAAAKKLTPFLVLFVFFTLTLTLIYKGLHNLPFELSLLPSILASLLVASLAALLSHIGLKKISHDKSPALAKLEQIAILSKGLRKAEKHLNRVQASSQGAMQTKVTELIDEIKLLSENVSEKNSLEYIHTEYDEVEKIFGYLQIFTACMMAFAHGANDVANAIGPIAAAISFLNTDYLAQGQMTPNWILALGGAGIVLGLATWGWRVIETVGKKITELTPTRGFAAEFGAAATILFASRLGLPISTTHTLVGAVIGVGMARGIEAINLGTIRDILASWFVTIPIGALLTCGFYILLKLFFV
jgi:PiT family inorganic phosphate transporter